MRPQTNLRIDMLADLSAELRVVLGEQSSVHILHVLFVAAIEQTKYERFHDGALAEEPDSLWTRSPDRDDHNRDDNNWLWCSNFCETKTEARNTLESNERNGCSREI